MGNMMMMMKDISDVIDDKGKGSPSVALLKIVEDASCS
jgi:hypothetical protein